MKKITMLSVIAAAMLFTGCGEDAKKSAEQASTKAVESTQEAASKATDAAKEAADKAVEATKEAANKIADAAKEATEATKEAASKAVESAKESVSQAAGAAAEKVLETAGAQTYAKCSGCHGADGKTKALGKSAILSGQSKEELVDKIKAYKAGTRNTAGMGNLMQGQVAGLDDASIEAVALYISTLK